MLEKSYHIQLLNNEKGYHEIMHEYNKTVVYKYDGEKNISLLPDGCPEIIFFIKKDSVAVKNITKNRAFTIDAEGGTVLGIRMSPLMNWKTLYEKSLQIARECDGISQEEIISYITGRVTSLMEYGNVHPLTKEVLEWFLDTNGAVMIQSIADKYGYTTRYIYKIITQTTGFNPKQIARICRFMQAVEYMENTPSGNNSAYIENLSYSDQAHFQREFKEFAGITPREFVRKFTGK